MSDTIGDTPTEGDTPTDCCTPQKSSTTVEVASVCPVSNHKGKAVKLITLKSLLIPKKLAELDPTQDFYFCKDVTCDVVYFSQNQHFTKEDLKVKVYQKESSDTVSNTASNTDTVSNTVPICYCFGWTTKSIQESADAKAISASISEHIQANRCACEINNPQGSCCLGNINTEIKQAEIKRLNHE